MKVAIDCRSLRNSPSGISNYLVTTINTLAQLKPTWQLFLLTNESFNEEHAKNLVIRDNIAVIICPLKVAKNVAFIWLLFKVRKVLQDIKPDLYWSPAFLLPPVLPGKVKTLVTVHDMVFKNHKETMSFFGRLYASVLQDSSINKADLLWANSNFTKEEILKYYPNRNVSSIFTGFYINTELFKPININCKEKSAILRKYGLPEKFILFVGTIEPRKNLSFLLSLMPELASLGYSLLIIGVKGWGKSNIEKLIEDNNYPKESISFAGFVTTEELINIYNMASVYVSTSLNEGFGMPQLEAMSCGCPVVSPHNSAMIEVVEGAGATVKSWQVQDWVQIINKVASNRENYKQLGFARARAYNKDLVIKNLIGFLKKEELH